MEILRRLQVYENSSMSLSCKGSVLIKGSEIKQVSLKGIPRAKHDGWADFFERVSVGDMVSEAKINQMLSLNGRHNIVAVIKTVRRGDPCYSLFSVVSHCDNPACAVARG